MKTKSERVTYWILTLLVALPFFASGLAYVAGAPPVVAGMVRLGYPSYLTPFLGVAKVLAALAIGIGAFPRLKDWAYAGLIFETIGAIYSHLRTNETTQALSPTVMLVVLLASHAVWKKRVSVERAG